MSLESAHLPIPLASLASASSAPDRLPVVSAAFRREDGHAFERWLERLPMDAVVRATGVSRVTLYRLFTPYGGLARFIWTRRLDRAREMISAAETSPRLADISDAVGLTSPAHFSSAFKAHFSSAFKAHFGVRPSELVFATH